MANLPSRGGPRPGR